LVRSSPLDSRSRARALLKLGDAAFREGRYVDALTRYRSAVEAAPDDAEAQFRKGHAHIANGKFDLAAAAFRSALKRDPSARRAGFKLDELYGAKSAAKGMHLENLAAAALTHEDSADNYFLLGLMLRFDGEHDRAEKFFTKAAALSPETRRSLARLLPEAKEEPVSFELGGEI
jgi:tetratricopeptide (TPR) repeat protein